MRYPVQARIYFSWKDEAGDWRRYEGTSRDISETGTFVLASTCPPVGADVELRIFLAELSDATTALRVEVAGRVVRVDQTIGAEGSEGFAVLTQGAILRENNEPSGGGNPDGHETT